MGSSNGTSPVVHLQLLDILPLREWHIYRPVLQDLNDRQLRYAVGGGLVVSLYGGHARNSKDLDIFIDPRDSEAVVDALLDHGFADLYERQRYRRDWIYRGIREDVILDVIWSMANRRADVSWDWFDHVQTTEVDGVPLPLMAPAELIWAKLYVMHRCDWPDVLNILNLQAATLDWDRLLRRIGDDWPLLAGVMCVFRWICPNASQQVPQAVWQQLHLADLANAPITGTDAQRAGLLDSYRDWFGPLKPEEVIERRSG